MLSMLLNGLQLKTTIFAFSFLASESELELFKGEKEKDEGSKKEVEVIYDAGSNGFVQFDSKKGINLKIMQMIKEKCRLLANEMSLLYKCFLVE